MCPQPRFVIHPMADCVENMAVVNPGILFLTSTLKNSVFFPEGIYVFLYGSQNKQRLFPYTTLKELVFITETECVYCAVRTGCVGKT